MAEQQRAIEQALPASLKFDPIPIWDPALFRLIRDERVLTQIVVINLELQKEVFGAQMKATEKIINAIGQQR